MRLHSERGICQVFFFLRIGNLLFYKRSCPVQSGVYKVQQGEVVVVVAGPLMIRRLRRELDISHFGESFDADEANINSPDRIKLAEKACSK